MKKKSNSTEKVKKASSNKKDEFITPLKKTKQKQVKIENDDVIRGPLSGFSFVISGEIESIIREDLLKYFRLLGATTPSTVSGKTTYLIVGDILEDGREITSGGKYKKAIEKGIKIINVEQLNQILGKILVIEDYTIYNIDFNTGKYKGLPENTNEDVECLDEDSLTNSEIKRSINYLDVGTSERNNIQSELWTDKYKPQTFDDIVGASTIISKLKQWLLDWNDVILKGNKKKIEFKGRSLKPENPNSRACLISGQPGIGKTTLVRLVCKDLGYRTYEENASCQRNKASINNISGYLQDSKTLFFQKDNKSKGIESVVNNKNVIIMDEIDGTGGNDDRGGVSALIQIIKKTLIPIIFICNDDKSQKLKSLTNNTYNLKCNRPSSQQIAKRLLYICTKENIKPEMNALERLAELTNNDIRQSILYLEMIKRRPGNGNQMKLRYKDIINLSSQKDTSILLNNFQAAGRLLNRDAKNMSLYEKQNLYFIDPDFIPLLIQENYLKCFLNEKEESKLETLEKISEASDSISFADILDLKIRKNNFWTLLTDKGYHSSVFVSMMIKNSLKHDGDIQFSRLFGKLQKEKKQRRITVEIKTRIGSNLSNLSISHEYSPIIMRIILDHLKKGSEGVDDAVKFMVDLRFDSILKEEFFEYINSSLFKDLYSQFEKIPSSIKSSFTKRLNERLHMKRIEKRKEKKNDVKNNEEESEIDNDFNDIEERENEIENFYLKTKRKEKENEKEIEKGEVNDMIEEDREDEEKMKKMKNNLNKKLKGLKFLFDNNEEEKNEKKIKKKGKSKEKKVKNENKRNKTFKGKNKNIDSESEFITEEDSLLSDEISYKSEESLSDIKRSKKKNNNKKKNIKNKVEDEGSMDFIINKKPSKINKKNSKK